jgi:hypothetical protein
MAPTIDRSGWFWKGLRSILDRVTLVASTQDDVRLWRFRQSPDRRLESIDEAVAWVEDVGLCVFQGEKYGLPSFYGAVAGRPGPAPRWGSHDAHYGRAWDWKDKLFSHRRAYYGKLLGDYRMLVSRALLPYLIAACAPGPVGDPDDYLALYEDGLLGADAKGVFEALLATGPASTARLRDGSHLQGKGGVFRRFEKALTELQTACLVAPVGIDRDNRWKYTFRYAPLHVAFPDESRRASELSAREASCHVLRHYLDLVGPTRPAQAQRLFGWTAERMRRVVEQLSSDGTLAQIGAGTSAMLVPG